MARRARHLEVASRSQFSRRLWFETLEDRRLLSAAQGNEALQLFSTSTALFVENQGQWQDDTIRYGFNGQGVNIAFTDEGLKFLLTRREAAATEDSAAASDAGSMAGLHDPIFDDRFNPNQDYVTQSAQFSVSFDGANIVSPIGLNEAETRFNYFVGDQTNWRANVPGFETVAYENLYAGIDLHTFGGRDSLKYEFHVAPGADWRQIQASYDGVQGLSIDETGALRVTTTLGELIDDAPYIYQVVNGEQLEVAGSFRLVDSNTYAFEIIGGYDPNLQLVIDPDLAWATYLGGSGYDDGSGVAVDASGAALVAGFTYSTDFAGRTNSYHGGSYDAFVAKVSSSGTLAWATYLGGSGTDTGYGVAVDATGAALVAGETSSTDFAGRTNSYGGSGDAFVAKVSSSGTLAWATYLRGSGNDVSRGVAVDATGAALVAGETSSTDFGGRTNSYHGGSFDAFVAKVSSSGTLAWATYLGGSGEEDGSGVAVDASGAALVAGYTDSTDFAGRTNSKSGDYDAFVVKVSSSGTLAWATYLGGSGYDDGSGVAVDASGAALVAGHSRSTDFAGRTNSHHGGSRDAFVAKVSSSGTLAWATYLGGGGSDVGSGVAVDASGAALVAGYTSSTDFVGRTNSHHGGTDAFLAKVSSSATLDWATYLGGGGSDVGSGVAVDASGAALVAGDTTSTDFAGRTNSYYGGIRDAFVARIEGVVAAATPTPPAVDLVGPNSGVLVVGSIVEIRGNASDADGISHVQIELYKGGTGTANQIGIISPGNVGDLNRTSYSWQIPATLNGHILDGTDFKIKWIAWDNTPSHWAGKDFSYGDIAIVPSASVDSTPPAINLNPLSTTSLNVGDTLTIQAAATDASGIYQTRLELYEGSGGFGNYVTTLFQNLPGQGHQATFDWPVPASIVSSQTGLLHAWDATKSYYARWVSIDASSSHNVATAFSTPLFVQPPSVSVDAIAFDPLLPITIDETDVSQLLTIPIRLTKPLPATGSPLIISVSTSDGSANSIGATSDFHVVGATSLQIAPGAQTANLSFEIVGDDWPELQHEYFNVFVSLSRGIWQSSARATVTIVDDDENNDTDGDGLLDSWELNGYTAADDTFVPLHLMGADPYKPDVFVEVDWLKTASHSYRPSQAAITMVANAFLKAPILTDGPNGEQIWGINLHVDFGPDSSMTPGLDGQWGNGDDVPWDNLSAGNEFEDLYGNLHLGTIDASDRYDWQDFASVKSREFSDARSNVFHYAIYHHQLGTSRHSGLSRNAPASDFIIAFGQIEAGGATMEAGTFMHELGHNLGLLHDGPGRTHQGEHTNYSPHYLSIMNYTYTHTGLYVDREPGLLDYSRFEFAPLNESNLNEQVGIGYPLRVLNSPSLSANWQRYNIGYWDDDLELQKVPTLADSFVQRQIAGEAFPAGIDWNVSSGEVESSISPTNINRGKVEPNKRPAYNNSTEDMLYAPTDWDQLIFVGGLIGDRGVPPEQLLGTISDELPVSYESYGDYNQDQIVDGADYVLWRKTVGTMGVPAYSGADGNGDGMIEQNDYAVWRAHFGQTAPSAGAGSIEPGAASQAAVGQAVHDHGALAGRQAQPELPSSDLVFAAAPPQAFCVVDTAPRRAGTLRAGPLANSATRTPDESRDDALIGWLDSFSDNRRREESGVDWSVDDISAQAAIEEEIGLCDDAFESIAVGSL